jgi:arylamine N-acetyltransferase
MLLLDMFTGGQFRVRRGLIGRLGAPTERELAGSRHAAGWYMQRYSQSDARWQDQYFFAEVEAMPGDFEVMNWAVATHPTSLFYRVRTYHPPPLHA